MNSLGLVLVYEMSQYLGENSSDFKGHTPGYLLAHFLAHMRTRTSEVRDGRGS